jgi:Predicted membrane protein
MNRSEFFKKLEQGLSRVSAEERSSALDYYNEYFDDAGPEKEQEVIEELGSPAQIAARIKADSAVKRLEADERPSVKKGISAVWFVILAIFAAPIALPLAIGAALLVIGLLAALVGVVIALVVGVAALLIGGIAVLAAGFSLVATSIPTALFNIGIGLFVLGISLLIGILVVLAARGIFGGIAKGINKRLNKKSKGDDIHG